MIDCVPFIICPSSILVSRTSPFIEIPKRLPIIYPNDITKHTTKYSYRHKKQCKQYPYPRLFTPLLELIY